jgi:UDP-3-O-[3-hydroxymyristoyl] N-acetylglucosamine deacetylase
MHEYCRTTVKNVISLDGVGVHTGLPSTVKIKPGSDGVRFIVRDCVIPARAAFASTPGGATVLACEGIEISTVEHLLSSLLGLGITDADIVVEGRELPILDGSAIGWCEAITAAGRVELGVYKPLSFTKEVRVEGGCGGVATYTPAQTATVSVSVDFSAVGGPVGVAAHRFGVDDFVKNVAWARTFVMASDVAALKRAGKGKGANYQNTIVWGETGPLKPLRAENEVAVHKLLDAIGDLSLLGGAFQGHVEVVRGSHALHLALVRAILAC